MPNRTKVSFIEVLRSKKLFILLAMGFASGLPFPLTHSTIQAWMTDAGLTITAIGYISAIIAYPYALKFLWAPFFDRYLPPILGRRRGWMLLTQLAIAILFMLIGFFNPVETFTPFLTIALLISILGATQDIVIDAYRVEILDEKERGLAMAPSILGYRIALIIGNSLAISLSDYYSWQVVYLLMSVFMFFGAAITLWADEPQVHIDKNVSLKESFILPLKDFLNRPAAYEILAFVLLYKFGEILATSLTTPFLMEIGFSKTEIGVVSKGVGLFATIFGAMAGGVLMLRLTLRQSLWFFGFIQSVATVSYLILAEIGKNTPMMATCIVAENFCLGMASSAFMAFLISLCNTKYTATQYALLTSIIAFVHSNAPALAGYLVDKMQWELFFVFCIGVTLPGLFLLLRFDKWMPANLNLSRPVN